MTKYATPRQVALIDRLAGQKYPSTIAAIEAYGLGLKAARDLTAHDASELIDYLKGKPIDAGVDRESPAYKAATAKAERDAAAFAAHYGRLPSEEC